MGVVGGPVGIPPTPTSAASPAAQRWERRVAGGAGAMMIAGAGLNAFLVTVRPEVYRDLGECFGDVSPWGPGRPLRVWSMTFAEHPRLCGVVVGVGYEATVGALALSGDVRRRTVGLGGVAAFHVGLLAMGLWGWALPVLALVTPATALNARAARVGPTARYARGDAP